MSVAPSRLPDFIASHIHTVKGLQSLDSLFEHTGLSFSNAVLFNFHVHINFDPVDEEIRKLNTSPRSYDQALFLLKKQIVESVYFKCFAHLAPPDTRAALTPSLEGRASVTSQVRSGMGHGRLLQSPAPTGIAAGYSAGCKR